MQVLASVSEWAEKVKKDLGLQVFNVLETKDDLNLYDLIVPKGDRRQGTGTKAMESLVKYADANGKRVVLSPATKDDYHGTTSRNRLIAFYKRFGFVENKGRNKDFTISDAMYRDPKTKKVSASTDLVKLPLPPLAIEELRTKLSTVGSKAIPRQFHKDLIRDLKKAEQGHELLVPYPLVARIKEEIEDSMRVIKDPFLAQDPTVQYLEVGLKEAMLVLDKVIRENRLAAAVDYLSAAMKALGA